MAVMLLTLVIGVLNVCLGYAIAAHMGYAPPSFMGAMEVALGQRAASAEVPLVSAEELLGELDSLSIEQLLDDEADDTMDDELATESFDGTGDDADASESLNPDDPEAWDLNEKYIETSILKLNIAMMKSGKRATDIDTRLRACRGQTDPEAIRKCLAELKEDCETYLAEQSQLAEQFSERVGELGELSALGDEIEMANLEQSAQVETTLNNLSNMDFQSDLEKANSRLLEEIGNLRQARHKLHDNQDAAFLAIAKHENRMDKIESRLFSDPLTKLLSRTGLEATLWQWWKQNRHQSRQMNAALLDLDEFGRVNEEYGPLVADRILARLAQLIQKRVGKGDLVGRYAGQRFLVVMLDVGPRAAIKNAEQLRQSIENVSFLIGGLEGDRQQTRVTVGGGITEVSPEDTLEGLFERLETTLKQAKKAGPNRAFFHDQENSELVESPDFGVEQIEIEI